MKLFIWYNADAVPYGATGVFVLAENLRQARELAQTADNDSYGIVHEGETIKIDVSRAKPDKVISKPRAVYFMHAE